MKMCLNCNHSFKEREEGRGDGTIIEKKFCSTRCRTLFNSKKSLWAKNHPKERKQLMKNYYKRNKKKHTSRSLTFQIMDQTNKICSICGSVDKIEIHHEIYPETKEEILQAIKDNHIYFLCKRHHHMESIKERELMSKPIKAKKLVALDIFELEKLEDIFNKQC